MPANKPDIHHPEKRNAKKWCKRIEVSVPVGKKNQREPQRTDRREKLEKIIRKLQDTPNNNNNNFIYVHKNFVQSFSDKKRGKEKKLVAKIKKNK